MIKKLFATLAILACLAAPGFSRAFTYGQLAGAGSGTTQGLYHFDGNSNDSSGNARNGSDTSMSYGLSSGRFNQGASCNGSTSKSQVTGWTIGSAGTFSFWINPQFNTGSAAGTKYVFDGTAGSARDLFFFNGAAANAWGWYLGSTAIFDPGTANYTIAQNTWTYITLVWTSTSAEKIYLNGALQTNFSVTFTANTPTNNFFCVNNGGSTAFWNGFIDEFQVDNVAWSAAKIAAYYSQSKGRLRPRITN